MENNIASILFARGIMPDDFISYSTYGAVAEIVKELKQLESERSELKELLWICQDFLPQGVGDESDYYDRIRARIKNSLKTK